MATVILSHHTRFVNIQKDIFLILKWLPFLYRYGKMMMSMKGRFGFFSNHSTKGRP